MRRTFGEDLSGDEGEGRGAPVNGGALFQLLQRPRPALDHGKRPACSDTRYIATRFFPVHYRCHHSADASEYTGTTSIRQEKVVPKPKLRGGCRSASIREKEKS